MKIFIVVAVMAMMTTVMEVAVLMTIMGVTTVLMERLIVLVEANEVVPCRAIQIIMSHKIQIIEADQKFHKQRRYLDRLVDLSS